MIKTKPFLFLLSLIFSLQVNAQLCQGSLGDPIVNITFGAGNNPGPRLSAAATGYTFSGTDCPNDGFYSVVNRTSACFSNSWHSLSSDHTGNTNGYFMLVNASIQPSAFYVDTVDALCNNTLYEFAAWIMNVIRTSGCGSNPIQPNLTFNIERTNGTVLKTYNTGDIGTAASPQWKQYGFFFSTPADANRIVLRITNNAQGGCGNDLALDDITFRPCGPTVTAAVNSGGKLVEVCEGTTRQVTFTTEVSAGYTDPHYQWQLQQSDGSWKDIPAANSTNLVQDITSSTPAGEYKYRLAVSKTENLGMSACSINSDVLTIKVNANPQVKIENVPVLCGGEALTLSASGGTQYAWTGPAAFVHSTAAFTIANATPAQSGTYAVTVRNTAGCMGSSSIDVTVHPAPTAVVEKNVITICEGTSTDLQAAGGNEYLWFPQTGLSAAAIANPTASPPDSTGYGVVVKNEFSCADTAYVQVNILKKPMANAGADISILQGQEGQLSATVAGTDVRFSWSPIDFMAGAQTLEPTVHPTANYVYTLQVESAAGCGIATDSVKVHVFKGLYIPNAFSPNNDGLNDTWNIPALNVFQHFKLMIFNRYGQKVYEATNNQQPWNGMYKGKELPVGAYVYMIEIADLSQLLKGWVMIVR